MISRIFATAAVIWLFFLWPCGAATAERRVALVIGNSAYRHVAQLTNPANDAKLMARTLNELGFTLVGGGAQLDLDKAALDRAVQQFGAALQGADVGLFYYAGHGVGVHGTNYLVPVDANPTRLADVDFQMLDTELVLRQMEGSGTRLNIVVLDACRNNPFKGRGLRATGGGLAQMQAPEGTLISFATQPGAVAQDGIGGDSPYTMALARTIHEPGIGLFEAFNQVGLKVKKATGGAQEPWLASSPISGQFFFNPRPTALQSNGGKPPLPDTSPNIAQGLADIQKQLKELTHHKDAPDRATVPPSEGDAANTAWLAIQRTDSPAILRAFISRFPNSVYADFARARLAELEHNASSQHVASAAPPAQTVSITPSFACATARLPAEIAICGSAPLARLDVQMDALYRRIHGRLAGGQRRVLVRSQRVWLDQRNACGNDVACLKEKYTERLDYLGRTY